MDLGAEGRWNTPAFKVLEISRYLEKLGFPVSLLNINEGVQALRASKDSLVILDADTCGPEAPVPLSWKQPHGFRIGLEKSGIRFLGSTFDSLQRAGSGNKYRCRQLLREAGLTVPEGVLVRQGSLARADRLIRRFSAVPCVDLVVKPNRGSGGGVAVHLVRTAEALDEVLRWHREVRKGDAVVERLVPGREFTVWVAEREGRAEAYGSIEFKKPDTEPILDQGAKIRVRQVRQFSRTVKAGPQAIFQPALPATLRAKLYETACGAFVACGLRHYARIDLIAGESATFVIDVNAHPDLGPTWLRGIAEARGDRYEDVLHSHIEEALATR